MVLGTMANAVSAGHVHQQRVIFVAHHDRPPPFIIACDRIPPAFGAVGQYEMPRVQHDNQDETPYCRIQECSRGIMLLPQPIVPESVCLWGLSFGGLQTTSDARRLITVPQYTRRLKQSPARPARRRN